MAQLRAPHPIWAWCMTLLVVLTTTISSVHAAGEPSINIHHFKNLPSRFFYFEDSTVLVYHDQVQGNVYISNDEGKSWNPADITAGKVAMVIPHPTSNQVAFALSSGTKHWRTQDRGKSWYEWEAPLEPAWTASPLAFHVDAKYAGHILYQGRNCAKSKISWGMSCRDDTYYVKEAFSDTPKKLLEDTVNCMFAHSKKEFRHEAPQDLVYCVGFDVTDRAGGHTLAASRIFSSTDYFDKETKVENLGIEGRGARGVIALAIVSKFAVAALKDTTPGGNGDMKLYVSTDAKEWKRAHFPHGSSARLRENAYTVVESTTHSLGVDVILDDHRSIGTFFVSSSQGTEFVQSLKDTNRNEAGYVDFETLYGVEGAGIANVVHNAQEVESRRAAKQLSSRITLDDGRSWAYLKAPAKDADGKAVGCDVDGDETKCSLHLHSVTVPHNYGRIFSSPAPGFVMGVGSIGAYLKPYTECDTFLSTDAGLTWKMVHKDAHIYEFGDQGGILIMANDEEGTDHIMYSLDLGKTWKKKDLGVNFRARALTTISDSTSQKFVMLGQLSRKDATTEGAYAAIHVDFAGIRSRQCDDSDKEKWYARAAKDKECMMGHKQWYMRRKLGADCYMGKKFEDPVGHEEDCPCEKSDYECDFGYVRENNDCVLSGPEKIGSNVCKSGDPEEEYEGSSGWRLIPGNTCDKTRGEALDKPKNKKCGQAAPAEGEIVSKTFKFPHAIVQHQYFTKSYTLLVRLKDHSIWQSSNEGMLWTNLHPGEKFLTFSIHPYVNDRAYLITTQKKVFYTTNSGRDWHTFNAPTRPNVFGIKQLSFHPTSNEYIIWTGEEECDNNKLGSACRAVAHYSRDNGRTWVHIEDYVRNCEWARDKQLKVDETQIMCEKYNTPKKDQRLFGREAPMQLISGTQYFTNTKTLFNQVVGFTKFSEYLVVAEVLPESSALSLQVSLDGQTFAHGMFPPGLAPESHSYTILESTTDALFVYMTISDPPAPAWGSILKSNSNGTYFGVSVEHVNRDELGYVDFEKMIGIDGVGLINVVSNPQEATISGRKSIQSKITHNDGGSWKFINPPRLDSNGQPYPCKSTKCSLHIHGYTERYDPLATYSTPSVPGMLMAVGSVSEHLAPYKDSDTFISRDAGFTWEEVHKDAHLWEFGDSGSILVAANDEGPTDSVLFTTNEGMKWRTYKFSEKKMRVRKIITVPTDTSRKFILLCESAVGVSIAVQIDFSSLTNKQCTINADDPGHDDFELWSPSEERQEVCLFGRQTLYHRRKREVECKVGDQPKATNKIIKNCECTDSDFECEYNHERNDAGQCVLIAGQTPLNSDDIEYKACHGGEPVWHERTAYRRIAHSSCDGGIRLDMGKEHTCPGYGSHSAFFWWMMFLIPFGFAGTVAWWWHKNRGFGGAIRLPGPDAGGVRLGGGRGGRGGGSGVLETIASVPWFVVGIAGVAWEWATDRVERLSGQYGGGYGRRSAYRNVAVDEDAQPLRFEDED